MKIIVSIDSDMEITEGRKELVISIRRFLSSPNLVSSETESIHFHIISTLATRYLDSDPSIKRFKIDEKFNTLEVILVLESMHITYKFAPPYEHEFMGKTERMNRMLQDMISFHLSNKNKYGSLNCLMLLSKSIYFRDTTCITLTLMHRH